MGVGHHNMPALGPGPAQGRAASERGARGMQLGLRVGVGGLGQV